MFPKGHHIAGFDSLGDNKQLAQAQDMRVYGDGGMMICKSIGT
jgi:hypothetical protein